jgi:hypothetical protein
MTVNLCYFQESRENKMIKIGPCDPFVADVLNCGIFLKCSNCFRFTVETCIQMRSSILNPMTMKAFRVGRIKIIRISVKPSVTSRLWRLLLCNLKQYVILCCTVDVKDPVILWWTPFTGQKGSVRHCGTVRCFFTEDRRYRNHNLTKVSWKLYLII